METHIDPLTVTSNWYEWILGYVWNYSILLTEVNLCFGFLSMSSMSSTSLNSSSKHEQEGFTTYTLKN